MDTKVKSQLQTLAYGEAFSAAAEAYRNELLEKEKAASAAPSYQEVDVDDLLNDPDLERLHAERLAALQQEAEKRVKLQQKGHGKYEEVQEGDFLELVTKTNQVVCHFFHREFERCLIMDKHLGLLAPKHIETRFIKLSAPDAPFFTEKLQVRMLPCIIMFVNGVAVDRVVGFDQLGKKDDFPTSKLEDKFIEAGVVNRPVQKKEDSDDESTQRRTVRQGFQVVQRRTESDEDSDFD